jgi:hypothetical protein
MRALTDTECDCVTGGFALQLASAAANGGIFASATASGTANAVAGTNTATSTTGAFLVNITTAAAASTQILS